MKKIIYSAAAMALAFFAASCQQENLEPVAKPNTVTYTVQVADAVATKALGDEITAVNELVYEVYRTVDEEETDFTGVDNLLYHKTAEIKNGTATIELEFVNDQNFTVLFWAHAAGNTVYDVDDLTEVTIATSAVANNVNAQAFVGRDFVRDCVSDANGKVTLVRPVSQLNIATTPESLVFEAQVAGGRETVVGLEGSSVTVNGLSTTFNIATLTPGEIEDVDYVYTKTMVPTKDGNYETLEVNGTPYTYVSMNYVGFAPTVGANLTVSYIINTTEGNIDNEIINVPVKPNYRTNIVGNLITSKTEYTITLEKNWDTPSEDVYAIWDGQAIAEPALDDAAAEPTYIISDAAELAWLAAAVNGTLPTTRSDAAQTFKGYNFVLTHDIDLNNEHWTPIGTKEGGCFEGAFDGNGHKIMNLKYQSTEDDWYVGLFGTVKDATIKNLTIENANIYCEKGLHFAALVGDAAGTTVIENVTVQGDVKVAGDVTNGEVGRIGAVVGGNNGNFTLKNVTVNANEGSYVKGNSSIGGVAGQLQGTATFENVTSNIDVVGYKFFAGGIIGLAPAEATFTSCSTSGNVSIIAGRAGNANDLYRVGAIAGSWDDGAEKVITLIDCSYTGELSGKTADGTAAVAFDCAGFVGRGYSAVAGAKVVVNGAEYVYAGNGSYKLGGALLVANAAGFTAALEAKAERIVLLPGVYEGTYAIKADNTTIEGQNGAVVACINLNGAKNTTIKNVEFDAALAQVAYDYKLTAKQYANIITGDKTNNKMYGAMGLVIDACKFTGTFVNGGTAIAFTDYYRTSGFSGNITIKNCTFDTENGYYDIYAHYTGNGINGYGNFEILNNTFSSTLVALPVYLGRYASSVPVVVRGNDFSNVTGLDNAVYVQDHSNYGVSVNASNNTFIPAPAPETGAQADAALAAGENVKLDSDLIFSAKETSANSGYGATGLTVNGSVFDGNGYTVTANDAWGTWDCTINAKSGTIKNVTVSGAMRGIFMGSANGDVYIDNVIFDNVIYTFNSDGGNKNYGVYLSNSTLNGWTSFSNVHKEVVFTNCTFGTGNGYAFCRPYNPCVFENCEFSTDMEFDTKEQANIVFKNCTYGGVKITAENAASLKTGEKTFFYNGVGSVSFE